MAWVEQHRNSYLVREWRNGKKETIRSFANEPEAQIEAQYFLKHGKLRPITSGEFIQRLDERAGKKKATRSPRLADYAKALIASDTELGDGSREGYESTFRNHLQDSALGRMQVADITPQDVREFWAGVTPKKVYAAGGKGTRGNVHQLLAKVLNQAVMDGIRPNSPLKMSGIKRPSKKRHTEVNPMTFSQIEELAAATTNERDRLMVLLAGYVGLRAGEVGGLRVRDLDAKRCRLTVAQAVVRTRGGRSIRPPKTESSRRVLTIPCSLAEELAGFLDGKARDLIFTTRDGGMIDHVILTKVTQKAAGKAGLGSISFHELRHACASLLIDSGANPRAIQQYMGHSDISTTLQTYGHLFAGSDAALADSMQARREEYLERIKRLPV